MKRLFCLLLSLCLLLLGCSAGEAEVEGYTFTDDLGHSVTVQNPSRVAILLGSYAEAWTLAGGSFCAAVDDAWEEYDLNIPEDAVNLGNTKSMSLELLLSVQPDFVIASTNTSQHLQWEPTLEAAEIPVAYFDVYDFEDYLRMMKIFTDITERPDCYETYGLAVEEEIQSIITESQARTNDPTVLVLRISAATIRVRSSQGSILGEILRDLRCTNIADSDETLLENLSIERILQEDPDHIFLAPYGDDQAGVQTHLEQLLTEEPAWAQLTAVKEGRVHVMDKSLFSMKPNHRWAEAYAQAEEILANGP